MGDAADGSVPVIDPVTDPVIDAVIDAVLDALDGVDPALLDAADAVLAELRAELEERARRALELIDGHDASDRLPLRVPKGRMADLQVCERLAVARHATTAFDLTGEAALRGVALDRFVLLELLQGPIVDPVEELLSVLDVQGEFPLCDAVVAAEAERPGTFDGLAAASAAWRGIDAPWSPRVQSAAALELADGTVVCSGRLDVELGGAGTDRPGVVVEVKSGAVRMAHLEEVALYALLVGLRDGRVPALVARWYPGAALATQPVDVGVLRSAAARLGDSIEIWAQLQAGRSPVEAPGPWCAWCPDAESCPSVRRAGDGGPGGAAGDDPPWEPESLDDGSAQ